MAGISLSAGSSGSSIGPRKKPKNLELGLLESGGPTLDALRSALRGLAPAFGADFQADIDAGYAGVRPGVAQAFEQAGVPAELLAQSFDPGMAPERALTSGLLGDVVASAGLEAESSIFENDLNAILSRGDLETQIALGEVDAETAQRLAAIRARRPMIEVGIDAGSEGVWIKGGGSHQAMFL